MTNLTQRYSEMTGKTRTLESHAKRLTSDAARLRQAISDMTEALEKFSVEGPTTLLRRAAEEIRMGTHLIPRGQYQQTPVLMAAE